MLCNTEIEKGRKAFTPEITSVICCFIEENGKNTLYVVFNIQIFKSKFGISQTVLQRIFFWFDFFHLKGMYYNNSHLLY